MEKKQNKNEKDSKGPPSKRQQRRAILSKIERLNIGDRYWKNSYGRSLDDAKKIYRYMEIVHDIKVVAPFREKQRIALAQKLGERKYVPFEKLRERYIETIERKAQINRARELLAKKAERVRINQYGRYKDEYLNKKIDNKNVLANLIKNSKPGDRLVLRAERNGKFIYRNISNADEATRRAYLEIIKNTYRRDELGIADSVGDLDSYFILENNPTLVKIMIAFYKCR